MKNKCLNSVGMTLMEILIVSTILLVAIVGLWGTFIASLNCIIRSQELNIVADDLKDVFEKIKNVPFADTTLVFDNVPEVDGSGVLIEDGQDTVSQETIGEFLLDAESIIVKYPQITAIIPIANLPDPLEIEVEVTWRSKSGKIETKAMRTMRTSLL